MVSWRAWVIPRSWRMKLTWLEAELRDGEAES